LTAQHVVVEKQKQLYVVSEGKTYKGVVLQEDPSGDVALVGLGSYDGSPSTQIIGNVERGEEVVVKTLDPTDFFYKNGRQSHREVALTRYEHSPQVKKLLKMKQDSDHQVEKLFKRENKLVYPYIKPEFRSLLATENGPEKIKREDYERQDKDGFYHYFGVERTVPGMSGSGVFTTNGQLVGIVAKVEVGKSTASGFATWIGSPALEGIPKDLEDRVKEIEEELTKIERLRRQLDAEINELIPLRDIFATPSAIVNLLRGYCDSTASARASSIQESLERILTLYPGLDTPLYRRTFLEQINSARKVLV